MFCCGEVVSDSAAVLHCGPCAWLVTVLPWCIVVRQCCRAALWSVCMVSDSAAVVHCGPCAVGAVSH